MSNEKKLNIKAIIIGWLLDIVGYFIAISYLMIVFVLFLAATKGISGEITEALKSLKPYSSISYNLIFLFFTFLSGYVAASIAKRDELKHALIVGISTLITIILLGISFYLLFPELTNDSYVIEVEDILLLFQIPFAVLGGYLRKTTRKEVREQKNKPLKKIFATVIVAIVILIIVPLLVLRHLIKDELPPQDDDLQVSRIVIPEKENAFYYFTLATEKLYFPEDKKQLIKDMADGDEWDSNFADELMKKNKESFYHLEEALTYSNSQFPEDTESDIKQPLINIAKLGSIKAAYFFRQGKEKEAFDEAVKLIKTGHMIQDSKGDLSYFEIGTIVKEKGLSRLRMMLKDTALAPEILAGYIKELEQFKVNESGLAYAIKLDYQNIYKDADDLAKQQQKDDLFGKFSYQPNKTKRMFAEAFREVLENVPKSRSEMRLEPPKRLKFEELNLSSNMVGEFLYRSVYNDIIFKLIYKVSLWRKCIESFSVDGTQLLLALKLYKIKAGKLPLSLNELVPEYISKIPDDPFDGNPVRYSAEKKIIYTVSTDLKDSGGNEYDYAYRIEF